MASFLNLLPLPETVEKRLRRTTGTYREDMSDGGSFGLGGPQSRAAREPPLRKPSIDSHFSGVGAVREPPVLFLPIHAYADSLRTGPFA